MKKINKAIINSRKTKELYTKTQAIKIYYLSQQ